MALRMPVRPNGRSDSTVKAVLGPTNTGKTHLAIERLCAHSSGAIGFPLRLLAREVYDRVCAIKGAERVALITGEERIEPPNARWLLCTAEAMPASADLAFMAIDEAQLAADRERGHIFTDRLLHARGREETLILGASTLEPMVKALVPEAEIVSRPRFSTLSHVGAKKLSRIPPRSAIVAFSAEQVYAVAEMLRRFRGGAAVVMGALSPQTRNAQVELYQSGEVDYLVATDAIGMGLNLDIGHVAFAGLSKFDGVRQRRLYPAEMAQIAGRAGRHQRDGTFGTLSGSGHHDATFTDDEVYAIEEHRFAPLTRLFWREAEPRFDSLAHLIHDLETPPDRPELMPAPEAIDLAVLKRLADDSQLAGAIQGKASVRRFWDVCSLPDFRHQGVETHSRFVARLWQELRGGYLGADFVAARIAELDNVSGDIDTLQGRIAAIRSWAYIAQRPDWILAREEMATRARAAETKLSDALHARLTERFVNRRTSLLMRKLGPDAAMLPVELDGDTVLVDGEAIGQLAGFHFRVDPAARHADHKLLLAAAERHLPALLTERVNRLLKTIAQGGADLVLEGHAIEWDGVELARLTPGRDLLQPQLVASRKLGRLSATDQGRFVEALGGWLANQLQDLAPLSKLSVAATASESGAALRALLIRLVERGGALPRAGSGLDALDPAQRDALRRLGVRIGALDLFTPAMLKRRALDQWFRLAQVAGLSPAPPPVSQLAPVLPALGKSGAPTGYRRLGRQLVRIDMAEKLLRQAFDRRGGNSRSSFTLDRSLAVSMGLSAQSHAELLGLAGFRLQREAAVSDGAFGPPAPPRWRWRPQRRAAAASNSPVAARGAFAALAELVR